MIVIVISLCFVFVIVLESRLIQTICFCSFSYSMDQLIDMNEEDALAEINLEDTQLQAQKSETQVGESSSTQET